MVLSWEWTEGSPPPQFHVTTSWPCTVVLAWQVACAARVVCPFKTHILDHILHFTSMYCLSPSIQIALGCLDWKRHTTGVKGFVVLSLVSMFHGVESHPELFLATSQTNQEGIGDNIGEWGWLARSIWSFHESAQRIYCMCETLVGSAVR